jgi:transposase
MAKSLSKSVKGSKGFTVQKPQGMLTPRVKAVGPERFGIVVCDCAKARFKLMLADYYGTPHLPPTEYDVTASGLRKAIERVRETVAGHELRDLVVVAERTGEYHRPVQDAFVRAGYHTRVLNPHVTKQHRQAADPGNKTDDTDLAAMHRAVVQGFATLDPTLPTDYAEGRQLVRHRRDLVGKISRLRVQTKELLHALMPGFAACYDDLWRTANPIAIVRHTGSPQAVLDAGVGGLADILRAAKLQYKAATLDKLLGWARHAPPPYATTAIHRLRLHDTLDDIDAKERIIQRLERHIAHRLVRTPYVLLLALPGINVVSAADFGFELGPIADVAHANKITGRAGLFPCRYQSDRVDSTGPLVRAGNRRLRAALLQIGLNLNACNQHFRALDLHRRDEDEMPSGLRLVKTAKTFSRIAYRIVRDRTLLATHPALQTRHHLIQKVNAFHTDHGTATADLMADLQAVVDQLPRSEHAREATSLQEELAAAAKKRGPQPLTDILPLVLARLGVIQSTAGTDLG